MASQSIEDWIQLCYDSEFAQRCGARLSKLFSENLARLQADEKSFQDWVTPEKNVARCLEILGNPEGSSVGWDLTDPDLSDRYFERFAELVDLCSPQGTRASSSTLCGAPGTRSASIGGMVRRDDLPDQSGSGCLRNGAVVGGSGTRHPAIGW